MSCPENAQLLAMVEQKLDPAQLREVERHVEGCAHCKRVVASVLAAGSTVNDTPPKPADADEAALQALVGTTIGERYSIKTLIGRGGVGAVYLARDLSLGRDVALKLHREASDNERLHREAIAMAQLAHPNVVTVHEVGSHHGRLYVAMEYVRGATLRGWLGAAPRTWREIVDLLVAAGEGLAAAHTAELVHRDFKPENVLVGEDSRPRVSDFGLVRVEGKPSEVIPLTPGSSLDTPMTVTGAVMGTPAYMALEQLAGAAVDARSDQFAFCVVAWECLFGERPFVGSTLAALALAIERQELQLPKRTTVPDRVRKVLERGLAATPAARFPSMPALLAQLRAAAAPRMRRRIAIAAAAVVPAAAVIAVLAASSTADDSAALCQVGDDALAGAWDAPTRDKLRATFTPLGHGEQLFQRVASALDDYRTAWIGMRRASCEATRVRGDQSETLLDLRMACLDRKRDELRTLTHGLAEVDRQSALGAVRAALGLSPIADCADKVALGAPVRPPDAQLRARVEAERAALADVRGLRLLGRTKPALEKARAIAARAKELKYRPLEAEALEVLGDLEDRNGDTETAIAQLEQAVVAANAGNHRIVAARAWSGLAWLEGFVQRHFDRADLAVRMAGAAIEALGGNAELAAQLINYEALILDTKNQLAPARAKYQAALAARERISGTAETWQLALVLNDLASVERRLGDLAAARTHHERALAIRKRLFGDQHPYVFSSVLNLGNVAWSAHDYKRAEAHFRDAIAMTPAIFPPQHPQVALALANLASSLEYQDRYTESVDVYRRALAMYEAVRGPEHPDVADTLRNLGSVLARADRIPEAREVYERALAILDTKKGDGDGDADPELATLLCDYGDLLAHTADRRKAEAILQRSLALATKANPDDPDLAFPLTALGELHATHGRARDAVPLLERALALRTEPSEDRARTELALATALWPADRPRALELARAAQTDAEKAPGKLRDRIAQWLAAHH